MTESETDTDMAGLDALFAEVRSRPEVPDAEFLARLATAAVAAMPAAPPLPSPEGPAPRGWRGLFDLLGGWQGAGGLGLAAMTGLWFGISPPEALDRALTGSQTVELFSDTLSLLEEG